MHIQHSFTLGNQTFILETGELARQATGAVRLEVADTVLLATGRDTQSVRPLAMRTGVLPRTHGSALFTRGETQALAVAGSRLTTSRAVAELVVRADFDGADDSPGDGR